MVSVLLPVPVERFSVSRQGGERGVGSMVKKVFYNTVKNSSWPEKGATFFLHQLWKIAKYYMLYFWSLEIFCSISQIGHFETTYEFLINMLKRLENVSFSQILCFETTFKSPCAIVFFFGFFIKSWSKKSCIQDTQTF